MKRGCATLLFLVGSVVLQTGCTVRDGIGEDIPWSINVPEMSVRLVVKETRIELGRIPVCLMEVMNTSERTVLLRRDFSLNGPCVYDREGELMPQRRTLEIRAVEGDVYHSLGPGKTLSVKAKPNYRIDSPGKYTLRFSIEPGMWGFEDPESPGKALRKDSTSAPRAVSNEMTIVVYY